MIQGCNRNSCQENEGRGGWSREEVLGGESKAIVGRGNSETARRAEGGDSLSRGNRGVEAGAVIRETGSETPVQVGSKVRSRWQWNITLRYNISFDKTHTV